MLSGEQDYCEATIMCLCEKSLDDIIFCYLEIRHKTATMMTSERNLQMTVT